MATFNIQHGQPADGGPVDPNLLVAVCAALDAEVLALQEVDRGMARSGHLDLAGAVARSLGLGSLFSPALRRDGGEYGNALLTRAPVTAVGARRLPRRCRQEPRALLLARTSIGGMAVSTAVTHLGVRQRESRRQLRAVLEELAQWPPPRLLLGDLNRHPEQVAELCDRAGFTLAGGHPSWPAADPWARIDHVAVQGLQVVAVDVVATPLSDHRAVVAELQP